MAQRLRGLFLTGFLALALALAGFLPGGSPAAAQQMTRPAMTLAQGRNDVAAGNFARAASQLTQVIDDERSAPVTMAEAFYWRGIANRRLGENAAALSDFANAVWLDNLPPALRARLHGERGRIYAEMGNEAPARAEFAAALRLAPEDPEVRTLAGVAPKLDLTTGTLPASKFTPFDKESERAPALSPHGVSTPEASAVYSVQLAALADEQSARSMWQDLRRRHGDLLGGLEAQFEPATDSGHSLVRLRVGPVATLAATRTLCEQLRQRGQDCYPVGH